MSAVRAQLEERYPPEGATEAWEVLHAVDPDTAGRLHPNDRKRIIRALEVHACCGRTLSSFGNDFENAAGAEAPFDALMIGLTMERALLYRRIDARVDRMLEQGLLEEVRRIYSLGLSRRLPAMQSIGYRQLFAYLDGQCSYADAVESVKRETRRYAKRQIAWFKRDQRIHWFDAASAPPEQLAETVAGEIRCRYDGRSNNENQ